MGTFMNHFGIRFLVICCCDTGDNWLHNASGAMLTNWALFVVGKQWSFSLS